VCKPVAGAVSIDIRGAKGPNAVTINGTYDPTDEICNDWSVFQKRGDPNKWLEYFNQSNKWYIKATNDKGKARGWMRLASDPTTPPELCKSISEVWDGSRWTSQPSVTILTAKQRNEEDMKAGSIRRLRATPVRISGASGPSGPSINGVYEPTDEICGGWPVYRKKDDNEKWLEYIVATNEWYVKPTADKGKAEGWMCIASDPPTRPELSSGTCDVWDGERWTTQNSVEIALVPGYFRTMTDVQIFCNEEIVKSHERFTQTLLKTMSLVAATGNVSKEKIALGEAQLTGLNKELHKRLGALREQKEEEMKQEKLLKESTMVVSSSPVPASADAGNEGDAAVVRDSSTGTAPTTTAVPTGEQQARLPEAEVAAAVAAVPATAKSSIGRSKK
jgi:hypothetical protein